MNKNVIIIVLSLIIITLIGSFSATLLSRDNEETSQSIKASSSQQSTILQSVQSLNFEQGDYQRVEKNIDPSQADG